MNSNPPGTPVDELLRLAPAFFPDPPPGTGSAWVELARRHGDYAIVGVGALVRVEGGAVASASVALIVATQAREGDPKAEDAVNRVSDRVQAVGCFFAPTDFTNYGQPGVNVLDFMRQQAGVVDPTFEFYDTEPKTAARRAISTRRRIACRSCPSSGRDWRW